MKRSKGRKAKAAPVELTENELGDVAGGYMQYKLKNALVTGYTFSGVGEAAPESADTTLSSATPTR